MSMSKTNEASAHAFPVPAQHCAMIYLPLPLPLCIDLYCVWACSCLCKELRNKHASPSVAFDVNSGQLGWVRS